MGKKSGYNPETPVFLGTTNVNLARSQRAWRLALFIISFCIDILSALTLFTTVHLWNDKSNFSLWISLKDFYKDTSDLIVLSFIRIVCLSGLAYVGSSLSWKEAVAKEEAKLKPKPKKEDHLNGKAAPQANGKLRNGEANGEWPQHVNSKVRNGEANGDIREPLLIKKDVKNEKSVTTYEEWFSGSSKKDVVLFVTFLLCTAFQAYVGGKCVSYYFDDTHKLFNVRVEIWQSILMGPLSCGSMQKVLC